MKEIGVLHLVQFHRRNMVVEVRMDLVHMSEHVVFITLRQKTCDSVRQFGLEAHGSLVRG